MPSIYASPPMNFSLIENLTDVLSESKHMLSICCKNVYKKRYRNFYLKSVVSFPKGFPKKFSNGVFGGASRGGFPGGVF